MEHEQDANQDKIKKTFGDNCLKLSRQTHISFRKKMSVVIFSQSCDIQLSHDR